MRWVTALDPERRHTMRVATKWLCGLLVAVMALTSPLLSRPAVVQAAELSSETSPADADVSDADRVGARFLNVAYVPGNAILSAPRPLPRPSPTAPRPAPP